MIELDEIELIPVLELEPFRFSKPDRKSPSETGADAPDDWHRHWVDSLDDSGITDLNPVWHRSWHVPTVNFNLESLRRYLAVVAKDWGLPEELADPTWKPALSGGLACDHPSGNVRLQPSCCSDLGNLRGWSDAAQHREAGWTILWIGHPWLSVRFQEPRLIVSEQHESENPVDWFAVYPRVLEAAIARASEELERFAGDLASLIPEFGILGDPMTAARLFCGLSRG